MVKTPLGIIALFVSIIELFLAYPVTQLAGTERLIMVIFMTVFPFFVSSAFFLILWFKPIHLYSPQDITPGLENRFQTNIAETTAQEVQLQQLEKENQLLRERSRAPGMAILKPEDESLISGEIRKTRREDLADLEEEIRASLEKTDVTDEVALQTFKQNMQRTRIKSDQQIGDAIRVEMEKFRSWLSSRDFQDLPEIPQIMVEPRSFLNAYYEADQNKAHIGEVVSKDIDLIAHTYFSVVIKEVSSISTKDETSAILLGMADYFSCSYADSPALGKTLANAAGLYSGSVRDLTRVISLGDAMGDIYGMSQVWSGACWEIRGILNSGDVDQGVHATLTKIGRDTSMVEATKRLIRDVSERFGEHAGETVEKVFMKRGVRLPSKNAWTTDRKILATSNQQLAIPDNDTRGVTAEVEVMEEGTIQEIMANVHISHTYIGDLVVTLYGPSGNSVVLLDRVGGSKDDITDSFSVANTPGIEKLIQDEATAKGIWSLNVCDMSEQDVGTLNGWELHILLK